MPRVYSSKKCVALDHRKQVLWFRFRKTPFHSTSKFKGSMGQKLFSASVIKNHGASFKVYCIDNLFHVFDAAHVCS